MASQNEKVHPAQRRQHADPTIQEESIAFAATADGSKRSIDEAYNYLRNYADVIGEQDIDMRRLKRKIDYRILPLLWFIYGLQFLDKFLLNYAIVMGLPEDLKLKGNQLNNIASSLWWAYLAVSPLIGIAMNKVPLGKFLGTIMFLWGVVISCTAAVKNYPQLMAIRILMGISDAGITPSLMLMSSQYYKKDEQAARFAVWFSAVGTAMVFGGLISFGFQHVTTDTLESWRIMYLVLGLISLIVGLLSFCFLPDTPMNAKFLTPAEKTALIHHVSVNQTGITGHKIEWSQFRELCIDPQIWLLAIMTVLVSAGSGILGTYATTLIKSFGFTSKQAALLNMPSGAIGFITTLLAAWIVRYHILSRWTVSIIGYILSLTGACLVAFAPHTNRAAQLAGIYMVSFSLFTIGVKYQWTAANVAGHTKRSLATAVMSAAFSIGHICAPYAVQKKEAPRYQTGKDVLVAMKAGAILMLCLLGLYYVWANHRRDRIYGRPSVSASSSAAAAAAPVVAGDEEETWENLTDRERKSFRYVL